jgi:tetratricopeptide (TPR) repeat protein
MLQGWGFYDQAVQAQREALTIRQELGDQLGIGESLIELAWALMDQGDLAEAERLMRESLALYRALDEPFYGHKAALRLGHSLAGQGRVAEAYPLLEKALAAFSERGGVPELVSWATVVLSQADLSLGRYAEAGRKAQASLALARDVDARWWIGAALGVLGCAAMAQGAYPEAQQRLQESLDVFQGTQTQNQVIGAHADMAGAALLQGNTDKAQQHLLQALRLATEYRATALLLALPFVARLLAEQGHAERAVEIYALASRYPYVANSRWYEDLVGQRIAAVAATLPPEVVAAAQERGRARDRWATAQELLAELEG